MIKKYYLYTILNKVTTNTKLFCFVFYFIDELGKVKQMIYKLALKNTIDVKNLVKADSKKAAICYFAALLHLSEEDLLNIYIIQ